MSPTYFSVGDGIYCLEAHFIRDEFAGLYIMQENDEVAIIETGTWHSLENLLNTLHLLGIDHSQVKYVIPTHIHLDHAGGAGHMMELFTQARLIIHPRGARHMIDPAKLIAGSTAVYGEQEFKRLYHEIKPIDSARVDVVADNESVFVDKRELLFLDTPGHARHHFCIYDQRSRGIFSGDTFGSGYPPLKHHPRGLIPTTTPVHFDPDAFVHSIDRLIALQPKKMFLTHFGELNNPQLHAPSLKRWIAEFVEISERIDASADDAQQQLEQALRHTLFKQLQDGLSLAELHRVLDVDIGLNSQGLLHWRRSS